MLHYTKTEVFIKGFFSKYKEIQIEQGMKLRIWSHLLKKSLMQNFIFCAVGNIVISQVEQSSLIFVFLKA